MAGPWQGLLLPFDTLKPLLAAELLLVRWQLLLQFSSKSGKEGHLKFSCWIRCLCLCTSEACRGIHLSLCSSETARVVL